MRKEVKAGESRAFEGRAGVTKAGRGQLSSCRLKSVLRPAPRKRTRAERACGRQEGPCDGERLRCFCGSDVREIERFGGLIGGELLKN